MPNYQKGFTPIVFILVVILLSGGIIGGSLYIKKNNPSLINKVTNQDSLQIASKNDTELEDPVRNDKTNKVLDPLIKYDFQLISKVLGCHILKNPSYPVTESEVDKSCMFAGGKFPINQNTGRPYSYQITNNGKGYLLRAKLSTGETYIVTEKKDSSN